MAQDTTMNFQFTQLGVDLATKALAGTTKITFTKAVASSENHFSDTEATALALTTLGEVQQTIEIKTVMAVTDNKAQVKVPVVIDRGAITTDYSLLSIGLYAKDDDGTEVLYAVNGLQDAVEMRANAFNSMYSIDLYVAVGTSDNVTLTVDAAGMLPRTEFTAVMAEYMKIADMPKDLAYTDKANTFTEQQTLAGGAVDGKGNAIATTKNLADGDAETLTSAKAYADTKVSGKADDSKVSTLQTQVNNSAVGTNLYTDTKNFGNLASWLAFSWWKKTTDTYKGLSVVQTTANWSGVSQYVQVKKGDILTYSVYAKNTSGTGTSQVSWQLDFQAEGSYSTATVNQKFNIVTITDSWQRVSGTVVATSDGYLRPRLERTPNNTNTLQIAGIKVEKGNVATDWCPNPEDKVNVADMRKPASDVAGIEEVNVKADDSKVAHLSGANNFDTVPTVNNNPLLLASSLPSDLARTGQDTNFTAKLQQNGQDVALANNTIARNPNTGVVSEPVDFTNLTVNGGQSVATSDDLKSIEDASWRELNFDVSQENYKAFSAAKIVYKINRDEKYISFFFAGIPIGKASSNSTLVTDTTSLVMDLSSVLTEISDINFQAEYAQISDNTSHAASLGYAGAKVVFTSQVYISDHLACVTFLPKDYPDCRIYYTSLVNGI